METAPGKDGKAVLFGTPAFHGSNMDTKVIKGASILYPSVKVSGAMVAIGNFHATMGDGEVIVTRIEIESEVPGKIDLIKDKKLSDPMLETVAAFYTITSGTDIDAAAKKASNNMFEFLKERLPLSNNEITMLMSIICDLQISQLVAP